MANFLRKFVKSKSRSKSPIKHHYQNPSSNYAAEYSGESLMNENEQIYYTSNPNYCHNSLNYNKMSPPINSRYLSPKMTEQHLFNYDFNENEYINYKQQNDKILSHENCSPHLSIQSHQLNKYLNFKNNKNSKKLIKQQRLVKNNQNRSTIKPFSQTYSTLDHNNKLYDDILTEQYNQDHLFGQNSSPHWQTTTTNYDMEPSSSNTLLKPLRQSSPRNLSRSPIQFKFTPSSVTPEFRPTSSECLNDRNLGYENNFLPSAPYSIGDIYATSASPLDYKTDKNLSNKTKLKNESQLQISTLRPRSVSPKKTIKSEFKHPSQSVQFQWFIESSVPCPILKAITDTSLETCMRLSKRFAVKGLEIRCAKFIQENVEEKPPIMALCWLNWIFKHHFGRLTQEACLPVVARLPLQAIEKHRKMLPEKIVSVIIAMKLRTCYQQAAQVFYTIHKIDHFYIEMNKCPRCGRQREQGKIRVQGNPCQRLIGCERCLREFGCEIERKSGGEYEAFHQCEHGLWPFNDRTEDCYCQTSIYRANFFNQKNPKIVENVARLLSSRADDSSGGGGTSSTLPTPIRTKKQNTYNNTLLSRASEASQRVSTLKSKNSSVATILSSNNQNLADSNSN